MNDTVLLIEPELLRLCRDAGVPIAVWDGSDAVLERAGVVIMGPDWAQLQAWRIAGHTFGALVVLEGEAPPRHRALLEPIALVDEDLRLAEALEQLARGRRPPTIQVALGTLDLSTRVLSTDDGDVKLTQREADLVAYLASRGHRDVARDELQIQVWGHRRAALDTRSVDMAIVRLRKKIERDPTQPVHLLTSRGGGYRWVQGSVSPHNLAAPTTSFVGRQHELELLERTLGSGARLVTLVGPPGSGKTRLATTCAAAATTRGRHPGGLWFCDLVPARSVADVVVQIATALSLALIDAADPLQRLADHLGRRGPTLLILDNAEHVVEPVTRVIQTCLAHAADLQILVTTQVRLEVHGEHLHDLRPLTQDDARSLFLSRAAAAGSPQRPSPQLDLLLERLDRLPLALELAAGRTRTLTLDDLVAHLEERLAWLDRGPTSGSARHHTLRTAIHWAWELLEPAHQDTLVGLASFRGDFSAATAASVLDRPVLDVADHLLVLLDRSLIVRRDDRFALLESIRAFAIEQGEPAQVDRFRANHAQTFVRHAGTWLPAIGGREARAALSALTGELGNLTAAWETLDDGNLTARTTLSLALNAVHRVHGGAEQRQAVLDPVIEQAVRERAPLLEARLVHARGRIHRQGPDYDVAVPDLERAGALFAELGQRHRGANAYVDLAYVRTQQGSRDQAFGALAEALALDPDHALADTLQLHLQHKWRQPITTGEAERMRQNVERLAARGSIYQAVSASLVLAQSYIHLGLYEALTELRQVSLERARLLPDRNLEVTMLAELAMESSFAGDYAGALTMFDQVLELERDCGTRASLERSMLHAATVALHQRDHDRCRRWLIEQLESICALGDDYREIYSRLLQICLFLDRDELDQAERIQHRLEVLLRDHETPLLRNSLLQVVGIRQLLLGQLEVASETLRAAHYAEASPSTVAQTMALQGVAAARSHKPEERQARGEAVLQALRGRRVPSLHEWIALGEALVHDRPESLRVYRDGPAHGVLRLVVRAWLPARPPSAGQ